MITPTARLNEMDVGHVGERLALIDPPRLFISQERHTPNGEVFQRVVSSLAVHPIHLTTMARVWRHS